MSAWPAVALLALLSLARPAAATVEAAAAPAPSPAAASADPGSAELAALRAELDDARSALRERETAPPWAVETHQQLLLRVDRLQGLLERLAARVEKPVPRLDEPLVLLTVAAATLVLGFIAGRTVQRRSSRRDRFRL